MPAKKPKQPDEKYPLKLTAKQRESLVHATRLPMGLKTSIKEASKDQQFIEFTKKELEKMGEEIYTSLAYVPPADRKRLNAALDKIDDLLDDLEGKQLIEKRHAVHKSGAIYQFMLTLKQIEPPIRRRIQVPDCTLEELHEVLQVVMGWECCHLYRFIVRVENDDPHGTDDATREMEVEDDTKLSVSQIARVGQEFRLIYEDDFEDYWQFEILLERILESVPNETYPRCIEGERASPPEDVGGNWGYSQFLEAISDPDHEQHDDLMEWVGSRFDPEKFSVEKVNKELGELH